MGYHTDFLGEFGITPTLKPHHKRYLDRLAWTRRMKRNAAIAETLPDPIRLDAGLPIGVEGEYFVGAVDDDGVSEAYRGQRTDPSVVSCNVPPAQQPALWLQWVPSEDGTKLVWDQGEKFYYYADWLKYLVKHFFRPWGYQLNGTVTWQGDETCDRGILCAVSNKIDVRSFNTSSTRGFYLAKR